MRVSDAEALITTAIIFHCCLLSLLSPSTTESDMTLLFWTCSLVYLVLPSLSSTVFFEDFEQRLDLGKKWTYSSDPKYRGRFAPSNIYKGARKKGNAELKVPQKSQHYAMSAMLLTPFNISESGIVVQFETTTTEGRECGGRYLKLITWLEGWQPEDLNGSTQYSCSVLTSVSQLASSSSFSVIWIQ